MSERLPSNRPWEVRGATQGSAKAGANRMELLELENVIGHHPRAGLDEGPFLAQRFAQSQWSW